MNKISNYAVWFDSRNDISDKIIKGFRDIYNGLTKLYEIKPSCSFDFEDMFFKIGNNFYLIRVEEHWSPGDISGLFKSKFLSRDEQVMAILISRDYYIPHHGMTNISQTELMDWSSFAETYEFRRKDK